jgi:hypothetical protein
MSSLINDGSRMPSGKYKTVGSVKLAPKRSVIAVLCRMKEGPEREYLTKWAFKKYYSTKFIGNLTDRIKLINNNICYNYIVNKHFENTDPSLLCETDKILDNASKFFIQYLNSIDPPSTGIYMDYLIRRLICELTEKEFTDNRSDEYTNIEEIIETNKQVWQFNSLPGSDVGRWIIFSEQDLRSKELGGIRNGERFLELDRENEWLKILFKNTEGWVRYLVPNVEKTIGVSGDVKDYIPNKWFSKVDTHHFCKSGCKMRLDQTSANNLASILDPNECIFPICQNECYTKIKNITNKTSDILKELLIVSTCHAEAFGQCPKEINFNNMLEVLDNMIIKNFINPLTELCKSLIGENILLNPGLGEGIYKIPSDCDLVVDDLLIDIKCTKTDKPVYEMLQLLGYSGLLLAKKKLRIKNVCVLNLLNGQKKTYDIEDISDNGLKGYLGMLANM